MSAVGPPPPSPQPKRYSERVAPIVVLEILDTEAQLADAHVPVVGVGGREVGEDPRAVDPLPQKAVVGERLYWFHDSFWVRNQRMPLRCMIWGRAAEYPNTSGSHTSLVSIPSSSQVEALAVDDLADERLPRGDVAVGLDPHAPGRLQPTLGDPFLHPFPQVGVVVAHPGQVLGLGDHEPVVGIPLHQLEHRAEGAGAFSDRLAERPQPRRVQMGVPDDAHCMTGRCRSLGQQAVEYRLRTSPTSGDVGELQQRASPFESGADPGRLGLAVGKCAQQLHQHPEVVPELVELGVTNVQVDLLEREEGVALGIGEQEWPRICPERGRWVGSRLDEQFDPLAAGGTGGEHVLAVIGREPLHRPAVSPHQGLGTESGGAGASDSEAQRHLAACPLVRDHPPDAEPGRVPGWPPRSPEREWLVVGGEGVDGRDRFTEHMERGHVHRH